ncbi:MAG TPA: hypothetical protein VHQ22_04380 [Terriglobales bacterium]|nr:hypothetical protein [Terriglobales bacterium]
MTTDKQTVYLETSIKCSSKTINDLVKKQQACFVLHVECSNTVYRKAFDFSEPNHRVAIQSEQLNDLVEVNVFARATKDISPYRVDKAHSDYGDVAFQVERGDILAVGEGQVFPLDCNYDSLSRIGSIMNIQESARDGDQPMIANFETDKIQIILSKRDFQEYKFLKALDTVSVPLMTAIVLPVLVEALHIANENRDDERRWVRVLTRKVESMGQKLDADALEVAQLILELPIKRTFASARMLAEGAS